MCKILHDLKCARAEASAKLHDLHRGTPEGNRQLMLEYQAAAQAVEDHWLECAECKREGVAV